MAGTHHFEWDPAKAVINLAAHGVSFDAARSFDFEAATIRIDERVAYGEERRVATGPIGQRLHVLVYTVRGRAIRVISLRKANNREIDRYEQDIDVA